MTGFFTHADTMWPTEDTFDVKVMYEQFADTEEPHFHEFIEIIYIMKGKGVLNVNGFDMPVHPGTLVYLLPLHVHALKCTSNTLVFYRITYSVALMLYLNTSNKDKEAGVYNIEYGMPLVELKRKDQHYVMNALHLHENMIGSTNHSISVATVATLTAIFNSAAYKSIQEIQLHDKPVAWSILEYVTINYYKPLDLSKIAHHFQLSSSQVNSALKLLTGLNFSQNLNAIRVRNAEAIMEITDLSITKIAGIVGYNNDAALHKQFKKIRKISPNAYRKARFNISNYAYHEDALQIYSYIQENFRENLTLRDVAKEFLLSQKYVNEVLQDNFGYTYGSLLRYIRATTAAGLLLGTEFTIAEITAMVGYSDERSFVRNFKEEYATTPSQFRNSKSRETRQYHTINTQTEV